MNGVIRLLCTWFIMSIQGVSAAVSVDAADAVRNRPTPQGLRTDTLLLPPLPPFPLLHLTSVPLSLPKESAAGPTESPPVPGTPLSQHCFGAFPSLPHSDTSSLKMSALLLQVHFPEKFSPTLTSPSESIPVPLAHHCALKKLACVCVKGLYLLGRVVARFCDLKENLTQSIFVNLGFVGGGGVFVCFDLLNHPCV